MNGVVGVVGRENAPRLWVGAAADSSADGVGGALGSGTFEPGFFIEFVPSGFANPSESPWLRAHHDDIAVRAEKNRDRIRHLG